MQRKEKIEKVRERGKGRGYPGMEIEIEKEIGLHRETTNEGAKVVGVVTSRVGIHLDPEKMIGMAEGEKVIEAADLVVDGVIGQEADSTTEIGAMTETIEEDTAVTETIEGDMAVTETTEGDMVVTETGDTAVTETEGDTAVTETEGDTAETEVMEAGSSEDMETEIIEEDMGIETTEEVTVETEIDLVVIEIAEVGMEREITEEDMEGGIDMAQGKGKEIEIIRTNRNPSMMIDDVMTTGHDMMTTSHDRKGIDRDPTTTEKETIEKHCTPKLLCKITFAHRAQINPNCLKRK